MILIVTSCGHDIKLDRKISEMTWGATLDCPTCGKLEILTDDMNLVCASKDFHQYMHDQSVKNNPDAEFHWPADGKGTGYVDVGDAADLMLKP